MVGKANFVYKTNEYTYSFKNVRIINTFGRDINNGKIALKETNEDQGSLLVEIMNFKKKTKPRNPEKKQEKIDILKNS